MHAAELVLLIANCADCDCEAGHFPAKESATMPSFLNIRHKYKPS